MKNRSVAALSMESIDGKIVDVIRFLFLRYFSMCGWPDPVSTGCGSEKVNGDLMIYFSVFSDIFTSL
jgi:hypothetical protein